MQGRLISMVACFVIMSGCGPRRRAPREIVHAPQQLLVENPVKLAGENPAARDPTHFNRCLTGRAGATELAACGLPYLSLPDSDRAGQVQAVLSHTLISHDWQKERLQTFLLQTRPELFSMLSCVKGLVISSDIRPSFFHPVSGGIYLDALYFAGAQEEAATVPLRPDDRQDNFDRSRLLFFSVDTAAPETFEQAQRIHLEGLLAHELAHACDFKHAALNGRHLSDALPEAPHNAAYFLAQWLFFGDAEARENLDAYEPAEIGRAYEESPVIDLYGYGNRYEHLAMIVQSHLSFEFDGLNRVDLLTDNPQENESLWDLPIHWGMTGKFCQPRLFEEGRALTARTVPMTLVFQRGASDCASVVHAAGTAVRQVPGLRGNHQGS